MVNAGVVMQPICDEPSECADLPIRPGGHRRLASRPNQVTPTRQGRRPTGAMSSADSFVWSVSVATNRSALARLRLTTAASTGPADACRRQLDSDACGYRRALLHATNP